MSRISQVLIYVALAVACVAGVYTHLTNQKVDSLQQDVQSFKEKTETDFDSLRKDMVNFKTTTTNAIQKVDANVNEASARTDANSAELDSLFKSIEEVGDVAKRATEGEGHDRVARMANWRLATAFYLADENSLSEAKKKATAFVRCPKNNEKELFRAAYQIVSFEEFNSFRKEIKKELDLLRKEIDP